MSTVISKPTLGGTSLPFPSSARIEPVWATAEHTTLGGTTRREVMNRKYRYILSWDFIGVSDYDAMETKVNTLSALTFVYAKWPQSESAGVSVLASLSGRDLVYGTGKTTYLSSVILTLTEVNSRI